MAITTVDGALAGMKPPERYQKTGIATAAVAAGRYHSTFYEAGIPGAGSAPASGVNGEALTTLAGQIPMTFSGNSHLARFSTATTVVSTVLLCDRLWQNSGLSMTLTTLQSITPVAIPARDRDGSTNGAGVLAGLEFVTTGGAGTPTVTLTYTDSGGTGSNTATFVGAATSPVGTFYTWPLAAGDLGVRSVEGYQLSATWTSGSVSLVLYRVLASISCQTANVEEAVDMLTGGFVRMYDNTVPFIIRQPTATTATTSNGLFIYTQG